MEKFEIQVKDFQGPLDLLLELIRKKKMHISDIALREVADDYLSFIERHQPFPMASASEFVDVASTLILIKSKALLPILELDEEEEEGIVELERRLKIHSLMEEVSSHIEDLFGKEVIYLTNPPKREMGFFPGENLDKVSILGSARGLLDTLPKKRKRDQVKVKSVVSLDKMIERLERRIKKAMRMSFNEFKEGGVEKVEVIVSFLAMLELVKKGLISASQESRESEIIMESNDIGLPRYD